MRARASHCQVASLAPTSFRMFMPTSNVHPDLYINPAEPCRADGARRPSDTALTRGGLVAQPAGPVAPGGPMQGVPPMTDAAVRQAAPVPLLLPANSLPQAAALVCAQPAQPQLPPSINP